MTFTESQLKSTSELLRCVKADSHARKLNLGCGKDIRPIEENWLNVDVVEGEGVVPMDIYAVPWPFADGEFDYLLASHVLEHVPFHLERYGHTRNFLILLMEEIWRILKIGGIVEIIVPGGIDSFAHAIDHKRIITGKTFHVFYPKDKWDFYTNCRFELIQETRDERKSFRVLKMLLNRGFSMNIDSLSSAVRTIVLKKLPAAN